VELQYSQMDPRISIDFPKYYPCSVLLGRVEVEDVVTHEQYDSKWIQYYREENGSPFVFICRNFKKLAMPLPISGQHKIWKLDKKTLEAATKQIDG